MSKITLDAPFRSIEKKVKQLPPSKQRDLIVKLKSDKRVSLKNLASKIEKRLAKNQAEKDYQKKLFNLENELYNKGFNCIAGVDEAGRGSLAGPLVSAGVILQKETFISGLRDSKQLSSEKREKLYFKILNKAIAFNIEIYSSKEIDKFGLHPINLKALEEAALNLHLKPDFVLVDGYRLANLNISNLRVIKGDMVSGTIAAASIVAKVYRDRVMKAFARHYPNYGFRNHKGYGSKDHIEALKKYGTCPLHRRSFKIVKEL